MVVKGKIRGLGQAGFRQGDETDTGRMEEGNGNGRGSQRRREIRNRRDGAFGQLAGFLEEILGKDGKRPLLISRPPLGPAVPDRRGETVGVNGQKGKTSVVLRKLEDNTQKLVGIGLGGLDSQRPQTIPDLESLPGREAAIENPQKPGLYHLQNLRGQAVLVHRIAGIHKPMDGKKRVGQVGLQSIPLGVNALDEKLGRRLDAVKKGPEGRNIPRGATAGKNRPEIQRREHPSFLGQDRKKENRKS